MEVKLYNTFTESIQTLKAKSNKPLRFYACGPTVYGPAHIGNFRTFVMQDVLRRLLECSGQEVLHVRNITDVDDKTIRQSQTEGLTLTDFCAKWTARFQHDCTLLGLLSPQIEPSAVAHIPEQIEMIAQLVKKGHAYVSADRSVYFRVNSFKDYGHLSKLQSDELQTQSQTSAGEANQADEYSRESICDFALWKSYKIEDGQNRWDSPWGLGRPGWHIECSAMALKYLGADFELHGGGIDLIFPHHENEIAQTEACTCQKFAQHWFHVAHLKVEGQKMSKSLGNLYTLEDLQKKNIPPYVVRYLLLSGDYRQPLNFTFEGLHAAWSALEKLGKFIRALCEKGQIKENFSKLIHNNGPKNKFFHGFWEALCEDLSTPKALGALFTKLGALQIDDLSPQDAKAHAEELGTVYYALGLTLPPTTANHPIPTEIIALADARQEAKKVKDFALSDAIRKAIIEKGWSVMDIANGYQLLPIHEKLL
jgi:cysteinyl-tRNA synthetase